MPTTLAEKVWDRHVVHSGADEPDLLYIDLHLVHEVTSPQAFDGLRMSGRTVRRPDLTIATEDHNVPTEHIDQPIADPISRTQIEVLRRNCAEFGIRHFAMGQLGQGHRPRHRARAGAHAAGHDGRVRRQPHEHPRRVRRARVRHRHERGRARARHADAPPDPSPVDGGDGRRRASRGLDREGRDPRRDRSHRHGRRHRQRDRVPGLGLPLALDGRPDDGVQHVDRGGGARRPHRSGRDDLRLPRRA